MKNLFILFLLFPFFGWSQQANNETFFKDLKALPASENLKKAGQNFIAGQILLLGAGLSYTYIHNNPKTDANLQLAMRPITLAAFVASGLCYYHTYRHIQLYHKKQAMIGTYVSPNGIGVSFIF